MASFCERWTKTLRDPRACLKSSRGQPKCECSLDKSLSEKASPEM